MNNRGDTLTSKISGPGLLFRIAVPAFIIALTGVAVAIMVRTKPKPEPKVRGERAALVNTIVLSKSTEQVQVHITGTVTPSLEITLQPRVSGEIVWTDHRFIPGGRFSKGERMLQIDPIDYQIDLTNRAATVAKAEFDLKTELGLQDIAGYEWDALQAMDEKKVFTDLEKELSLRKPHLSLMRSNLKAARAQLQQAQLNLDRASVMAPFNCVVRSRHVNVGSQVSVQTALADLGGSDDVWVVATIPVSSLKWIKAADETGEKGSRVIVSSVPGMDLNATWEGHVLRKLVDLETAGRQAQLIIEVPTPSQPVSGQGALLFGAYVRLTIEGVSLQDVYKIPSSCLHDGGSVWIMAPDKRLDVRTVETRWGGREFVFVAAGVAPGEKLVVSDLGTPIKGMLLQGASDKQAAAKGPGRKQ